MKTQKHKSKHSRIDATWLHNMLAQPPDSFYRLPEFSLRGRCLTVDGCQRVLDFTPEKICLDMGRFLVTFYGTGLRIESLAVKRILLTGHITDISFRDKWEGSGHEA